jgi:phosphoserine phosphatase RsbU/P
MPNISEQALNQLRASVEELMALNEIAAAINVSRSVEDITRIILDKCLHRILASQGAIFLLDDPSSDVPIFRTFVREISKSGEAPPLHLNWTLLGWMAKNNLVVAINNPAGDSRFHGIDFERLGITSVLAAPLIAQRGLIGALVLFNKVGSEGFTGEDKRFLGIVGSQTAQVLENARLFGQELALLVLEEEMKVARKVQEDYLPRENLSTGHYSILGYNCPAKEVAGDYYDMFPLDDNRVVLSIGDVAGKGIPAALLASEAQAVVRSLFRHDPTTTLSVLVQSLNRLFLDLTSRERYITALLAIYDVRNGTITYVNAGHPLPLLVDRDGQVRTLEGSNTIVGALEGVTYDQYQHRLYPGETLFLYTDGVTENFNPVDEEYGNNRLHDFLRRTGSLALESVRDDLITELTAFRGTGPQSDDITFLMLRAR